MKHAIAAAVITVVLYAAGLVPVIGQAVMLFAPAPVIFVYARHGRRIGLSAVAVSTLIVAMIAGVMSAAVLLFIFGLMAVCMGEGMLRRMRHETVVIAAGLLPVMISAVFLWLSLAKAGKSPVGMLEQYLKDSIADIIRLYTTMGLKEAADLLSSVSEKFVDYMVRLMPSIAVTTAVLQAACCYGIIRSVIIKKYGEVTLARGSFSEWYAPDKWVWGLVFSLALMMPGIDAMWPKIVGWNLVIIFSTLYAVQGMAVLDHVLKKAALLAFARGIIHAVVIALPSALLLPALGVVDIWADFRKLRHVR